MSDNAASSRMRRRGRQDRYRGHAPMEKSSRFVDNNLRSRACHLPGKEDPATTTGAGAACCTWELAPADHGAVHGSACDWSVAEHAH